jgi:hypothetical protein
MTIKDTNISLNQILQSVIIAGVLGCFSILYGIHNWQIRAEEREQNRMVKLNEMGTDIKDIQTEVKVMKETDMQAVRDRIKELELKRRD